MKIILSRKGLDSSFGGFPSPILPGGALCWLPIPDKQGEVKYGDLRHEGVNIGSIIRDLSGGDLSASDSLHLDPDLRSDWLPGRSTWVPAFGQRSAAQGHLARCEVDAGDLFLFFGWFRCARILGDRWAFRPSARDLHVIWGWLQVGRRISVREAVAIPAGLQNHPHLTGWPDCEQGNNTVYVASERLEVKGLNPEVKGAGVFSKLRRPLQLTDPSSDKRSVWRLPGWFHPTQGRRPLTYHSSLKRWDRRGDYAILSSVGRGQEFVLDCDDYPEAELFGWLNDLFSLVR